MSKSTVLDVLEEEIERRKQDLVVLEGAASVLRYNTQGPAEKMKLLTGPKQEKAKKKTRTKKSAPKGSKSPAAAKTETPAKSTEPEGESFTIGDHEIICNEREAELMHKFCNSEDGMITKDDIASLSFKGALFFPVLRDVRLKLSKIGHDIETKTGKGYQMVKSV